MIRYWLEGRHDLVAAACCVPMQLRRLAGCGPWAAAHHGGRTCITLARPGMPTPTGWTDEAPGTGGLTYQLASPLPPFDPAEWLLDQPGIPVALSCGCVLPVRQAASAGCVINLDGSLGRPRPAGEYAAALERLTARREAGEVVIEVDDPDIIQLLRLAIRSGSTLTDELIHAYELLSTADIDAILAAACGVIHGG